MQVQDIVRLCAKNNIGLSVVGKNIRVSGNKENLSPEIILGLKTKKGELIDFISRFRLSNQEDPGFEKIAKADPSEDTVLSYAQQRLWILDKLSASGAEYNLPMRFRLEGEFDESACRKAIEAIVERHEVLRTAVVIQQGEVISRILDKYSVAIALHSMSDIPQDEQLQEVDRIISKDSDQRFDLGRDVLLRAKIFSLSATDHIIYINIHHIAADGWSLGILYREFNLFYKAFNQGQTPLVNPLPIQYADFASWQRKWLQSGVMARQLKYWEAQLEGLPELHSLPLDKPRPVQQSYNGANFSHVLNENLLERVHAFCRRKHITLFMFLQSALAVLFSRYSGQEDIVLGTPVAGRSHSDVEDLIGLFVNTLVLRSHAKADLSFAELVAQNKSMVVAAFENQHIPFEALVESIKPQRSLSYSPLFQVMLTLHNNEKMRLDIEGVNVKENIYTRNTIKFDLEIMASEHEGRLYIDWTYCVDLFKQATMSNMARHLEVLVAKVLENEFAKIGDLNFLDEKEQHYLLDECNKTGQVFAEASRLETLFEIQVARVPEHTALKCADVSLNYSALNQQANRFAHYLTSLGVEPGACVAVSMQRNCEFIVAVLGVLKAGACYLPCDPLYPQARTTQMLLAAKAKWAVVDAQGAKNLADACATINITEVLTASQLKAFSSENPSLVHNVDAAASIIFTSGSTGVPKGVVLTHRGLTNRLLWMKSHYPAVDGDIFCQKTSLNFVDHLAEIFQPLCEGATNIIIPDEIVKDSETFIEVLQKSGVTHLTLVPSVLQLLLEQEKFSKISALKQIITSGEILPLQLGRQVLATFQQTRLINLYGSSEVSADVLFKEVSTEDLNQFGVTIGRPIANNKVHLLDARGYPVPMGVEAEMFISGVGLASGYLGASQEEENKRFVSFAHVEAGARLFRSGDIGKRLASGEIKFIGRNDEQIKIRGLRIEVDEIQNHLIALGEVRSAVVTAYKSPNGTEQLLGYITLTTPEAKTDIRQLCRRALQKKLPVYLVPDIFIVVDEMPRTSTGKVSKRLLPPPSEADLQRQDYVAPRNNTEALLAKMWSDILHLPKIGVEDNFFELGGHSLLATKLISRIRGEMNAEISFKSLFEFPSVAALAAHLETNEAAEPVLSAIQPLSAADEKNPSYAQQRLWFLDKLGEANAEYNVPMQLRVSGAFDVEACSKALKEIVRRHDVLRTIIAVEQGKNISHVLDSFDVPIRVHNFSHLNDEAKLPEVEAVCEKDSKRNFDLGADVLLRAHIFSLADSDHILFLNVHHIAIDGWSVSILYSEFNSLYNAYKNGEVSPLEELPIQYADYSAWQRSSLSQEKHQTHLNYWKTQLKGLPQVHALPLDKPRPTRQTFNGEVYYQDLGPELLQGIKAFCNREQLTLYMFMQTAFSILLARYSREQDIVFGTPVAGRSHRETENLIGLFVNTVVLRSQVDGSQPLRELLQRNKSMIMDAFEHQNVPLEFLVDELNPERSVSHSPLFQILFTLHNNNRHQISLDGALLSENVSFHHKQKFDLELELFELNENLGVNWAFNTDLFERESITSFAASFRTLLNSILEDPESIISQLKLVDAQERAELLLENDSYQIQVPEGTRLEKLFEACVQQTPNALAAKDGERSFTYSELNASANQLAAHMRALGVGEETLVGVCLPRKLDLLVALLAVFKSGAAYVPLDATYPLDRLDYMLEDSGAELLITESDLLKIQHGLRTLNLDDAQLQQEIHNCDTANLNVATSDNSTAYVIYTSGSTGKPKGVCIEQRAFCNFLLSMAQVPGLDKSDVLLAVTSVSFDIAGLELFLPLIRGASLVIANEAQVKDSAALQNLLTKENISVMQATPSTWRLLIAGAWQGQSGLKVLCGGEAWPASLNEQLQSRVDSVWNVYGPTETTVWSTVNKIEAGAQRITLGRPIANTQIHILDENLSLVPRGGIGEMYIGGDGLARGYLNRQTLTTEKFVANPFRPGQRLYRTGDLARWCVDNSLQYLGRSDFQIKIRGYRVEVEEIEKTLLKLDFVDNAVVIACEQENNASFLAAYIVPDLSSRTITDYSANQTEWIERCKHHLASQLPKFMVPECYVFLEVFPLTLNNKVDRTALPVIKVSEQTGVVFEDASTTEERAVCEAIKKALAFEKVGINDNFFALGGDSISAIKFLNALREFGLDVGLQEIFQQESNRTLAKKLYPYIPIENLSPFCLLNDDERNNIGEACEDIYPVSSSQTGLLLYSELHPETYNNVFNFRVQASWDEKAFKTALQSLLDEHPVLRTRFDLRSGTRALQYVQREIALPLSVQKITANQLDKAPEIIGEHVRQSSVFQYDATKAPLFSVKIFTLGESQFEYCLSFHHVIMDGWSASIFTNTLLDRYRLLLTGKALPKLEVNWQFRRAIASELQAVNNKQSEQYWRTSLENQPARQLPLDNEVDEKNIAASCFNEDFFTFSHDLVNLARKLKMPVQAVLLAVHFRVLALWSGSKRVVSTIGVSARPETQGADSALGLFVNALPLISELTFSDTWESYIRKVANDWSVCSRHGKYPIAQVGKMQAEILFNYTHFNTFGESEGRSDVEIVDSHFHEKTNFDFHVSFYRQRVDDKICMEVKYNQALYDAETVSRILDSYCQVATGMLANPQLPLNATPALPLQDKQQFLEWNNTQSETQQNLCAHEHFEKWAATQPDRVAVVFPDGELTYGELNTRANQLANYLRNSGVHNEEFVAVIIEPSVNVVLSILAILKAGAAYLPIDVGYPSQRIESLLSDSDARFVLYHRNIDIDLPQNIQQICIDDEAIQAALASCDKTNISTEESGISGEALAYMIYTSGSTGKPKGVMIEHKNICSLVADKDYVHIDENSVIAQASSISFDAATFEIWGALTAGAKLVHIEKEKLLDTSSFGSELQQKEIDVLFITTALFNKLVFDNPQSFSSLKYLLFGGEQASYEAVNTAIKSNPATQILHVYGPTETTTFASYSRLFGEYGSERRLPIGKPMVNTYFYVMSNGELLPRGARGELHIGGEGTGRGYWQRKELSEEKFINDVFAGKGRSYATGDAVRWLPNGEIEFIGRRDRQVKIRGFRIELDEIEKTLNDHPAVDSSYIATHTHETNTMVVCYFVAASDNFTDSDVRALRKDLKSSLPDYMIPAAFIVLSEFPLTTNGKVDKEKLPQVSPEHYVGEEFVELTNELEHKIGEAWTKVLGIASPGANDNFFDVGGNSLLAVKLRNVLAASLGRSLSIANIFACPSIASLADFLSQGEQNLSASEISRTASFCGTFDVAIIGMAGRFPGAKNIDEYWQNIRAGKEVLQHFSDEELLQAGVDAQLLNNKNYVKSGIVLEGIDSFDAEFFGFTPREAEVLDPQQRLLFECTHEVLEDGGYANTSKQQDIGTFVSVADSRYLWENINSRPELYDALGGLTIRNANAKDAAATRLAYKFNLLGPSVNINTACSSSLVAVHEACKSLWMGESAMAIAGGADIQLLKPQGYLYSEGDVLSVDGSCKAFDQQASGTRIGSGCGLVLLKPLAKALQDGDNIHAVIKGSAINNDGARKVGYTAPSVNGQAECIRRAISMSGVAAESVGYIEAHGTGTIIGDPIEIEALSHVYGETANKGSCAIGSVKSNIGHLNIAAGIAGLIKTVCVVKNKEIPPLVNFSNLNSEIPSARLPFSFNTELKTWEQTAHARRAGVSSFGIGGTNSHVVLEEYQVANKVESSSSMPPQLLLLSAGTPEGLKATRKNLHEHLTKVASDDIQDIAFTLQTGRKVGKYLQALTCNSKEDLLNDLCQDEEQIKVIKAEKLNGKPRLAFMFPGQGAQYVGMACDLYNNYPGFKETLDACAALARPYLKQDFLHILGLANTCDLDDDQGRELLKKTAICQPVIFSVEYALAKLLISWGLVPETMIGHSLGEYVAACLAGVFSLEDGIKLVCKRGALMQAQAAGSMLSINANVETIREIVLAFSCELAAENSPEHCVASGTDADIATLENDLRIKGIKCTQLQTSHAFHSRLMEPALVEFRKVLEQITLCDPQMSYISNLDGNNIRMHKVKDPQYWLDHLRGTVQFQCGVNTILDQGNNLLLEVGPGTTLSTFVRKAKEQASCKILSSVRHPKLIKNDAHYLLSTLAEMHQSGLEIKWDVVHFNRAGRKLSLPTYVYNKQRYWVDVKQSCENSAVSEKNIVKQTPNDWLLSPQWKRKPLLTLSPTKIAEPALWLLMGENQKLMQSLALKLEKEGQTCIRVSFGKRYSQDKNGNYRLGNDLQSGFENVAKECREKYAQPLRIVFTTQQSASGARYEDFDRIREAQQKSLYPVIALTQAIERIYDADPSQIVDCCVTTEGMHDVVGTEAPRFDHALVGGLCRSINQELSKIKVRVVDLSSDDPIAVSAASVMTEITSTERADVVAYRSGFRWVRGFTPELAIASETRLRKGGVYLITGGLGKIGLILANYLRNNFAATVVLQTRSSLADLSFANLPCPDQRQILEQQNILACHYKDAPTLYVASANTENFDEMETIFTQIESEAGAIHGVIHAAGQTQDVIKALREIDAENCERQFKPKIHGTLVLDRLLENRDLDFCMLMSSLSAVLGGIGYGVYAGVNNFMDMFSAYKHKQGDLRWLSVNWDGWNFDAFNDQNGAAQELKSSQHLQAGLTADEGAQIFARALCSQPGSQLIVCKGDFFERYKKWVVNPASGDVNSASNSANADVEKNDALPPETLTTERKVQIIWEKLFGISDIAYSDNFFEIGGDSLLLARMVANINAEFLDEVKVSIKDMFEYPTIKKMAELVKLSVSVSDEDQSVLEDVCCEEGEI